MDDSASDLMFFHADASNVGQASDTNDCCSPGAILLAIIAASIRMVPDPQNGSNSTSFLGSQRLSFIIAAASVSRRGASKRVR